MLSSIAMAQNTTKITGKKNEALKDSLQTTDYRYVLPIFGDEVRKKGYDMPLPAGMMLGVYTMEQDLLIDDLAVGFGNTELVDISDLVVFSQIRSNATVYTFRPDVWVFPFMNVYGIFNKFSSNTNVEMVEPFPLKIPETSNDGYGAGFGTTLAYGYGPVWFSGNFNFAWSKTPVLTKPTQSFSTSLRIGTAKGFNNDKHRLSVWVGTNYLDYVGSNGGSYDMTQLIPDDSTLLEDLYENVNDMLDGLNDRYEDFCAMPGNRPKCAVLDPILEEFKGRIEDKIGGVEFPEELNINYSFTSSPLDNWNMVAGAQYQFSKRWETRVEWGFLGSRRSFLFNVNYRFGLKRKV
jgi:hypothetical protein